MLLINISHSKRIKLALLLLVWSTKLNDVLMDCQMDYDYVKNTGNIMKVCDGRSFCI